MAGRRRQAALDWLAKSDLIEGQAGPARSVARRPDPEIAEYTPGLPTVALKFPIGLDASKHQGTIDWAQVAGEGIAFAIVKATEGVTYEDPTFASNWAQMRTAGLARGAYHYLRSQRDPVDQADNFLRVVRAAGGFTIEDALPVVDVEWLSNDWAALTHAQRLQWVGLWLRRVESELGVTPAVYTAPGFWLDPALMNDAERVDLSPSDTLEFGTYPLWIADTRKKRLSVGPQVPAAWRREGWTFWQYSFDGRVAGVGTNVDLDTFNASKGDLRDWLADRWGAGLAEAPLAAPVETAARPVVVGRPKMLVEGGPSSTKCDTKELRAAFAVVMTLRQQLDENWNKLQENPLVREVELIRLLHDLAKGTESIPSEIWPELWADLKAFGSCNAQPMLTRVKDSADYANAVLRVLHGLSAILQGYAHDKIDDATRDLIDKRSGLSKLAAKMVAQAIKNRVPAVTREIDPGSLETYATRLSELKNDIKEDGDRKVIWSAAVAIAEELFSSFIDDAIETGARRALKKLLTRLLGSAAAAGTVLFLAEELFYFADAVQLSGEYWKVDAAYNQMLRKFVEMTRACFPYAPAGIHRDAATWSRGYWGGHLLISATVRGFTPESGGDPGKGKWTPEPLDVGLPGDPRKRFGERLEVAVPSDGGSGEAEFAFWLPKRGDWPGTDSHYVAVTIQGFDASGTLREEIVAFSGACA